MSSEQFGPFDRETTLDLVVNAIPLAIMLFFIVLFVVVNPFGSDLVATTIQLTIVIVTFGALAILTYVSGIAISKSEEELEAMEAERVSESVGAGEEPAGELEDGEEADADGDGDEDDDSPADPALEGDETADDADDETTEE
jgi:hypothetical protein